MKNKVPCVLLLVLLPLWVGSVIGAPWPQISEPPRSNAQWVADNVLQNGIPMQVKTFRSSASLEAVMNHYRQDWTENGGTAIENRLGEWFVIGRREGDYYVTIQVRETGKSESEGFIAVNDLSALLDERASLEDTFPRMGGSQVVSKTVSSDLGRNATTLIFENSYTANANASFYVGELKSTGWSLRTRFQRPEAGYDTYTLYFERASEGCFITVADTGSGKTYIAVNLTDVSR